MNHKRIQKNNCPGEVNIFFSACAEEKVGGATL